MRPFILFIALMPLFAADPALERLEHEIDRLSRISGGVAGVSAEHMESGRRISYHGTDPFPMARTFKVPVAVELLAHVDKGEVRLDQMITLEPKNLHPGSGTLTNLFNQPGVILSVRNLLDLMLLISDNSAADLCLRLAGGPAAVTAKMRELGIDGIRVDRPTALLIADWIGATLPPEDQWSPEAFRAAFRAVTPEQRKAAAGRFNDDPRDTAQPDAMLALLEKIYRRELHKPETAELLLDIMRRCQTGQARIKGMLPPGTEVAHKTGTIGGTVDDVGIVTLPDNAGHVAIAVLVKKGSRTEDDSERTIAQIARSVYDYFLYTTAAAAPAGR